MGGFSSVGVPGTNQKRGRLTTHGKALAQAVSTLIASWNSRATKFFQMPGSTKGRAYSKSRTEPGRMSNALDEKKKKRTRTKKAMAATPEE